MGINTGTDATSIAPISSAVTPNQGVVEQPVLMEGLNNVFDQASNILGKKRETRNQKVVSDFTQLQLSVADALDQGVKGMTQARARTLLRHNLMNAIDANGGLTKELIAAHRSIIGLAGGAKIIDEGTKEDIRRERHASTLLNEGLVSPGATDAEIDSASELRQISMEAGRQHKVRMETLAERRAVANLSKDELAAIQAEESRATDQFLVKTAPRYRQRFQISMDEVINGEGTEAQKLVRLEENWVNLNADLTKTIGDLGTHKSAALLTPFKMMLDVAKKRATGELEIEEAKRAQERVIAFESEIALLDPEIRAVVVKGALIKSAVLTVDAFKLQGNFAALYGSGTGKKAHTNVFTGDPKSDKALKSYLKVVTDGLDSDDPEVVSESKERITSLFDSIEDSEGYIKRNPKAGFELVRWMKTPEFLAMRRSNPDAIKNLDEVKQVLKMHLSDEVWKVIKEEFKDGDVADMRAMEIDIHGRWSVRKELGDQKTVRPATETVGYESTPQGMRFIALAQDDPAAEAKARQLNKSLRPIINDTIQAMTNLDGSDKYGASWEAVAEKLFGPNLGAAGGDEGDDLELEDFQVDAEVEVTPGTTSIDGSKFSVNSHMNPLLGTMTGASKLTHEGADTRMAKTLSGPFTKLEESFGTQLLINDGIAKAGTSRESNTKGSRHFHGDALDISIKGMSDSDRQRLVKEAKAAGFTGFGFGTNILHLDTGPNRGWAYGNGNFAGTSITEMIKRIKE